MVSFGAGGLVGGGRVVTDFNNGSLQAGCVKFYISCTCIITASKYAHFFVCVYRRKGGLGSAWKKHLSGK